MRYVALDMSGIVQPLQVPDSFVAYKIGKASTAADGSENLTVEFLNLRVSDGPVATLFNKQGSGWVSSDLTQAPSEPMFRAPDTEASKVKINFTRRLEHGAWRITDTDQQSLDKLSALIERFVNVASTPTLSKTSP